jgi:methylmalonyl-CoA mutase C-terminal domain/subunit
MANDRPIRVLLAKPGLDGHDRGAKVVARTLRDAGMEVIYTGLRQSIEQILTAAQQEDPDVIALSILSGAHMGLTKKLIERAPQYGVSEIPIVVGGTIPPRDAERLRHLGVDRVFPPGADLDEVVKGVTAAAARGHGGSVQDRGSSSSEWARSGA